MNKRNKVTSCNLKPPAIKFPGGHVQIVNPHYPIKGVWSDVLYLKPNRQLPAHVHKQTSSLLICVGGTGEIRINGPRTRLRKGVCAFIPKGSEHSVKAGPTSSLTCLSINEGIIKPGSGADIHFVRQHPASTANTWGKFIKDCTKTAAVFQKQIRDEGQKWNVFSVRL